MAFRCVKSVQWRSDAYLALRYPREPETWKRKKKVSVSFACQQNPFEQADAPASGRTAAGPRPPAQQSGPVLRRREENMEDPHQ